MDHKDMSNEDFIQKILIEEIGEIKDKHPYLMCMLVSQGIEFLGKTLRPINNASGWNENQNAKKDFQSAIKLFPSLRKYAEIDIYQRIRCRFCEKIVVDDNMVSDNMAHSKSGRADDKDKVSVNLNDLYDDFKSACEDLLEMKDHSSEVAEILAQPFWEIDIRDGVILTPPKSTINCIYY